jgi:hypothetical protein
MQDMKSLGDYVQKATGSLPKLVLVILPTSSADIYLAVKQFGDVHVGVHASGRDASAMGQSLTNICICRRPCDGNGGAMLLSE